MVKTSSSGSRGRPVAVRRLALLAALALAGLLAGCGASATVSGRVPHDRATSRTSDPTPSSATPDAPSDAPSDAGIATGTTTDTATDGATDGAAAASPPADTIQGADPVGGCEYGAVGAALRPTVRVGGARVTVSGARLACPEGVMIYVADYLLTQDPADESAATAVGVLLPGASVTLAFPTSFAQCRASAVYFETIGGDADDARLTIRRELARWPASARAYAPPAPYVQRYPKTRILLGRNISGLGACKGKGVSSVTTPVGRIGACWTEGPASQPGRPEYVEVGCGSEHVYEVYYAKSLTFAQYTKDGAPEDTAGWAEDKALQICDAKVSGIRFSGNYRLSSIGTTYVWPTGLSPLGPIDTYAGSNDWDTAQAICLVRRSNNQPVTKRILR